MKGERGNLVEIGKGYSLSRKGERVVKKSHLGNMEKSSRVRYGLLTLAY